MDSEVTDLYTQRKKNLEGGSCSYLYFIIVVLSEKSPGNKGIWRGQRKKTGEKWERREEGSEEGDIGIVISVEGEGSRRKGKEMQETKKSGR